MAVKGKKKSQSRGSQGRRRPAPAPRAAYAARPRQPWYRTAASRVIAALVLLVAVIAVFVLVRSRPDTAATTQRRNALDQYTGDVRALLQSITPAATAENAVPNKLLAGRAKKLKGESVSWQTQLARAQQSVGNVVAPTPTTQGANILFVESVQLYAQAATTFGLAADAPSSLQTRLLASGGDLRNQASALWQEGINILDQARTQAKMAASALRIPTAGAVAPPTPTPTPTSGQKHKNKKNGKGNGGGQGSQ